MIKIAKKDEILSMYESGLSCRRIAQALECSEVTILKALKYYKVRLRAPGAPAGVPTKKGTMLDKPVYQEAEPLTLQRLVHLATVPELPKFRSFKGFRKYKQLKMELQEAKKGTKHE